MNASIAKEQAIKFQNTQEHLIAKYYKQILEDVFCLIGFEASQMGAFECLLQKEHIGRIIKNSTKANDIVHIHPSSYDKILLQITEDLQNVYGYSVIKTADSGPDNVYKVLWYK